MLNFSLTCLFNNPVDQSVFFVCVCLYASVIKLKPNFDDKQQETCCHNSKNNIF